MLNSAGAAPLALNIHNRTQASDDRLPCLKNPRPEGAESSLTESASSPFQAEPAQLQYNQDDCRALKHVVESIGRLISSDAPTPPGHARGSAINTADLRDRKSVV